MGEIKRTKALSLESTSHSLKIPSCQHSQAGYGIQRNPMYKYSLFTLISVFAFGCTLGVFLTYKFMTLQNQRNKSSEPKGTSRKTESSGHPASLEKAVDYFTQKMDQVGAGFYDLKSCTRTNSRPEDMQLPASYHQLISELTQRGYPVQDSPDLRETPPESFPPHLLPFYQDGFGNCVCFQIDKSVNQDGPTIMFWNHEKTLAENLHSKAVHYDHFDNWLNQTLS